MRKSLNKQEIKLLLKIVEEHKQQHKPLLKAFEEVANKTNRKTNSIRNFYYDLIEKMSEDSSLVKEYDVDINKHQKQNFKKFNSFDEEELKSKIENKLKQGFSVRNACLQLSNNNPSLMIRFQNKYRNIIKTERERENIIKFPAKEKKQELTDEEIKSLFLGLVKLVKNDAMKKADNIFKDKLELVNSQFRKTLVATNSKNKEIKQLSEKNKELKQEIKKLKQKIMQLRSLTLENFK